MSETGRYIYISRQKNKEIFRYAEYESSCSGFWVFKEIEGFEYIEFGEQIIRVVPASDTCEVVQFVETAFPYEWGGVFHVRNFARVRCTFEKPKSPVTFIESSFTEAILDRRRAAYLNFEAKRIGFIQRLKTIETELRGTPLHFYADCAVRSALCSFEFPWCQFSNYEHLEETLSRLDAFSGKDLLVISHEFFSYVQHCHRYLGVSPDRSFQTASPPWLTNFRLPPGPLSGYQPQYRFDAITAPSSGSDVRPDLTSKILDWLHTPSFRQVPALLITGDGGVGKSTLLRSICRQFDSAFRLHASFFFDAKHGSSDMARQLFKNVSADLLRWDEPKYYWVQRRNFLKPRFTIVGNTLVVIDALDECEEHNRTQLVMKLVKAIPKLPPCYRLLMTSRDEDNILERLLSLPPHNLSRIDMNEVVEKEELMTYSLATAFGNRPWIGEVVAKSRGLPRFAATACRFIIDGNETDRLALVLSLQSREGELSLYSLYFAMLCSLFPTENDLVLFRSTLTRIFLFRTPLSVVDHNDLISFDSSYPVPSFDVDTVLKICPLIGMDRSRCLEGPVQVLERSFMDFITNRHSGPFFLDLDQDSHGHNIHTLNQCLNLFAWSTREARFANSSLRDGSVSYAATLWPRHAINSLRHSPDIVEAFLKPFILRNILYSVNAVAQLNTEYRDYLPCGIKETTSKLVSDFTERLLSLGHSRTPGKHTLSFKRTFIANRHIPHICTNQAAVLYARRESLCFSSQFRCDSTRRILFRWKSFVTCPALFQFGDITLLACIRSSEERFLQIRTDDGKSLIYETLLAKRVVEMVAMVPHLVAAYDDGSVEQFTLSVDTTSIAGNGGLKKEYDAWNDESDFWPDDSYAWPDRDVPKDPVPEKKNSIPNMSDTVHAPIPLHVCVPDCNYVRRITTANPTTSAVALTFNCGADGHPLLGPSNRHNFVSLGGEIVYWNCEKRTGHSLKLPPRTPPISYMLFNHTESMVEGLEHLAAVTGAGSIFVWKMEGTECSLVGKFVPPKELTLPNLFAFEYYMLERPALELFSFKWEDGTVALYDALQCSLLHWVKATPALRVPWESLEVEEMNPEEIDPEELKPLQSQKSTTRFDIVELVGAHSKWIIMALLVYGLLTTLFILLWVLDCLPVASPHSNLPPES